MNAHMYTHIHKQCGQAYESTQMERQVKLSHSANPLQHRAAFVFDVK